MEKANKIYIFVLIISVDLRVKLSSMIFRTSRFVKCVLQNYQEQLRGESPQRFKQHHPTIQTFSPELQGCGIVNFSLLVSHP